MLKTCSPILLIAIFAASANAASIEKFDVRFDLGEQHSLTTDLKPADREVTAAERRFGGDALSVQYGFRANDWFADAKYRRTDDLLQTGMDSDLKAGKVKSEIALGRSWQGSNLWRKPSFKTTYQLARKNNGELIADQIETRFELSGPKQSSVQVQYQNGRELQKGQLLDLDRVVLTGSIKPHDAIEMGVATRIGDELNKASSGLAEQRQIQQFLNWNVNDSLLLQFDNINVDLASRTGQEILDASILNAHVTWQFDKHGSFRLSMMQRDIERNIDAFIDDVDASSSATGSELRYTWKPSPQIEFDLGYSDAWQTDTDFMSTGDGGHDWFMQFGYALSF